LGVPIVGRPRRILRLAKAEFAENYLRMKYASVLTWSLALALVVPAIAQPTNADVNQCVVPVPREGAAHERFLTLNQRVKENGAAARLIFVGDSITQGWEGNGKAVWAQYYAPRHALNLGIGSDHTQHVLWRLEHGNLDGLSPAVAVVLIGVNNIPHETNTTGQILDGVKAVVRCIREKCPETKVLVLGIFPFREDFNPQRGRALQINQALRHLEDGRRVFFLDFGHRFLEPDGKISRAMMRDFLHPTEAGYRVWAEAMEPTLARLLEEPPIQ
jgi:beta-glucosidase